MKPVLVLVAVLATAAVQPVASARAQAPEGARRYTCPIDGETTHAIGTDGRAAPKSYSDLEVPTQAYTNLVVACPKCGYAAWSQDFERRVDPAVAGWTKQHLHATARRAGSDPLFAYEHHVKLLDVRRAGLRERIGALLFYSYVLKRRRPPTGGQDHGLEQRIRDVRLRTLAHLHDAIRTDPPKSERARLEWQYLAAELTRLVGDARQARAPLQTVCDRREQAGYMVGKLACEMAARAGRGETWEDYRAGVFDVAAIPKPGDKPAPRPAEPAPAQPAPAPTQVTRPEAPLEPLPRQPPPRPSEGVQPPAPPTVTGG